MRSGEPIPPKKIFIHEYEIPVTGDNWKSGTGKCSHGGERDSSRVLHATGGINKETHSPIASPHYYLHRKAGLVATAATLNFFVGNETSYVRSVGAAQLGKILGLESECLNCFGPSQSIVFVIDTTGSMADDIRAVRTAALELVAKTIITPSYHPFNYILVKFNDPGTLTTYQETSNATEMQRWLNDIRVNGGYDCPEYSMTGLVKGGGKASKPECSGGGNA
ncbi:unnamed protein product [Mytilus coruscus]|uniref:VWFA domain-containing protein n=1 Tax=Mytilus coruscus TaxID=42192 RepID=A0A6J8D4U1_MYTCO|nr:unnamed protein product [Mytilus coruscus]